jgi:hypothetical protein
MRLLKKNYYTKILVLHIIIYAPVRIYSIALFESHAWQRVGNHLPVSFENRPSS